MTTDPDPAARRPGPDEEQLPCGRLLSQAWDADPGDDHPAHCPSCADARRRLAGLRQAVLHLRDASGPALPDAGDVLRRVMDVVRLELRPGAPLPLGTPDEDMWIMESAAARVLRSAAENVPGVLAGSCRLVPGDRRPDATADITVTISIHAPATAHLPSVADDVRRAVATAATDRLGLGPTRVDVHVTDLTEEDR
ncbi:Asp23/Gls24 family envelope stress response protein [Actinomadura flavalba]|uniref:Asp23/Gls24 family envelope stress response protein n=1 Tax=Actinomadura flavalba TaxID=1120938 RepID=UPI0003762199|nr:Asp23/Gls24 family envelope stress response protein [Actinomadura flavalba]